MPRSSLLIPLIPSALQCETDVEGCSGCEPLTGLCNRCWSGGLVSGRCVMCTDPYCEHCNGSPDVCDPRVSNQKDGCGTGFYPEKNGTCMPVSRAWYQPAW